MLVKSKFEETSLTTIPKPVGLFPCNSCIYEKDGYINPCTSFNFKLANGKTIIWSYTKYFNCDSKNVLYILICRNCDEFYIGQTQNFKQRIRKHKSDIKHPNNSTCKRCTNHIRVCTKGKEPFFKIYPFYYINDNNIREFKEKKFILKWKPGLNANKVF